MSATLVEFAQWEAAPLEAVPAEVADLLHIVLGLVLVIAGKWLVSIDNPI